MNASVAPEASPQHDNGVRFRSIGEAPVLPGSTPLPLSSSMGARRWGLQSKKRAASKTPILSGEDARFLHYDERNESEQQMMRSLAKLPRELRLEFESLCDHSHGRWADAEERVVVLSRARVNLRKAVHAAKKEALEQRRRADKVEVDISFLRSKVKVLEGDVLDMKQQAVASSEMISQLRNQNGSLAALVSHLRTSRLTKVEASQTVVEAHLSQSLTSLTKMNNELRRRAEVATSQQDGVQKQLRAAQERLRENAEESREKDRRICELQRSHEAQTDKSKADARESEQLLQEQLLWISEKVESQRRELEKKEADIGDLGKTVRALQQEKAALQTELKSSTASAAGKDEIFRAQFKQLAEEKRTANAQIEELQEERDALKEKANVAEERLTTLQAANSALEADLKMLRDVEIAKRDREIEELRSRVSSLEEMETRGQESDGARTGSAAMLSERVASLSEELAEKERDVRGSQAMLQRLSKQLSGVQDELSQAKEKALQIDEKRQQELQMFQGHLAALEARATERDEMIEKAQTGRVEAEGANTAEATESREAVAPEKMETSVLAEPTPAEMESPTGQSQEQSPEPEFALEESPAKATTEVPPSSPKALAETTTQSVPAITDANANESKKGREDLAVSDSKAASAGEPGVPEELAAAGWLEQVDVEGNVYYYNEITGVSSWELPPLDSSESKAATVAEPTAASYEIEL